jgi:hypothetical protein
MVRQNSSVLDKNRMKNNVHKHNIVLMYHHHKLLNLMNKEFSTDMLSEELDTDYDDEINLEIS